MDNGIIVKKTRELGTSAGVILPRSWLNKQVVVTLQEVSDFDILKEVLNLILKEGLNEQVKGIYLYGSYARGEQEAQSDIDVLVLTLGINKLINHGNYEVLFVSYESFLKNLKKNLNYQQILREAKVLLNSDILDELLKRKIKLDYYESEKEIRRVLKINEEAIESCELGGKNVPDGIFYSLVLRLKELYMLKCLIVDKKYLLSDFRKFVSKEVYSAYLRVKRNEKEQSLISFKDAEKLVELSKKWLKELKG